MCTSISYRTKDHYFGRNLDLEYNFGQKVVITPRDYYFKLKNGSNLKTKFAMVGMANVVKDYPLYAEATNEKGLSIAGLYFPGNAKFFNQENGKLNLAPYELIPYFLGQFESVASIRDSLIKLNIINAPFSPELPITELHWMISDENESIVLEQMKDGLKIYDNPVGVLTNNPTFDFHMTNLIGYLNLSTKRGENNFSRKIDLRPYGQAMGAIGLPGDSSPASRFVRACFNKLNSNSSEDEMSSVAQFFHILDSVSMVKGTTVTPEGKDDITIYSSCANTSKGIYYYKTYTNNQITAVKMTEENKTSTSLTIFELLKKQNILYQN